MSTATTYGVLLYVEIDVSAGFEIQKNNINSYFQHQKLGNAPTHVALGTSIKAQIIAAFVCAISVH